MHYREIAQLVSVRHHFHIDDVTGDIFAVIAHHNWSPTALTAEQADQAYAECIERTTSIAKTLKTP